MSLSIRTVQELQPHSRAWCKRVRIDGPDQSPPWWLSFKCRGPCLYIRIRRPVMLYLQSIKEISLLTPSPPPALLNTHADGQGSRDTSPSTAGSKWHQCGRNIWNDTCQLYLGSRLRGEDENIRSALCEQDMCSQTRDIHSVKVKVNDSMTEYWWMWETSVCEKCHPVVMLNME